MAKQESACCVYDCVIWDGVDDEKWLIDKFEEHCKKWSFQLEQCPSTGTLHYQCRISLKEKQRIAGVVKLIGCRCNVSITSKDNRDNMFYVCKVESRVRGPWKDDDERPIVTSDIARMIKLRPWQEQLLALIRCEPDDRSIHVIYDPIGNQGKTKFAKYCRCNNLGRKVPLVNDYKDVVRMVCDMPTSRCYFIDMPRAINKERLNQFYSAIEDVKNGWVFDDRYKFREKLFDPPHVIVFTNHVPDEDMMSKDRWFIWKFGPVYLETYERPKPEMKKYDTEIVMTEF